MNHFRKLALIILLPSLLVGVGGGALMMQQLETEQLEQLGVQSRTVSDLVLNQIEMVRTRADSIQHLPTVPTEFFSEILFWAELKVDWSLGVQEILRSIESPRWKESVSSDVISSYATLIDGDYLLDALKKVNFESLKQSGVAILRFKQAPNRPHEWLAFVFSNRARSDSVIFALVDPSWAFPVFKNWAHQSEGGVLRAYLVGGDGYILSHSLQAYAASDLSRTSIFKDALKYLFSSQRVAGVGTYQSMDQVPVLASYRRLGELPLGVVVERIKIPGRFLREKLSSLFEKIPILFIVGWFFLLILALLGAVGLTRVKPRVPKSPRLNDRAIPNLLFGKDALLIQEATMDRLEAELETWLLNPSMETLDSRLRFEALQNLMSQVSVLWRCPALFFSFHSATKSAVLTGYAGVDKSPLESPWELLLSQGRGGIEFEARSFQGIRSGKLLGVWIFVKNSIKHETAQVHLEQNERLRLEVEQ